MSEPLTFTLPPELLEQIAQRAAAILAEQRRTSTDEASEVLSPQDAARLLGLHPRTILRAIGSGDLQAVKVRNRWRIRRDALDHWLDRNASGQPTAGAARRRGAVSSSRRPLSDAFGEAAA